MNQGEITRKSNVYCCIEEHGEMTSVNYRLKLDRQLAIHILGDDQEPVP